MEHGAESDRRYSCFGILGWHDTSAPRQGAAGFVGSVEVAGHTFDADRDWLFDEP